MNANQYARVSVIIPARNEEVNIGRVVRSLANQPGIREILVVNDESTDRTEEILTALEAEYPLLRTLRVASLPEGWMGKTRAIAEGARAATGDWLLFTDADTEHQAGSLAELLQRAEDEHADLLSLSPGQKTPTWWEKSIIPLVYVKLASLFRFEEVSDPQSPTAAANGQYVLVRREIYERSGGHAAVKSAILEDVELARRIKAQGGKLLFLPGAQWVQTRMYRSFREMWQGWTKNLFLLYGGDDSKMLAAVATLWLLDVLPALAFAAVCLWVASARTGGVGMLVAVGLFSLALARQWNYGRGLARLGFDPALANYQPIGAALLGALLLGSLHAHRGAGNIEWKGRHYATKGKG
ncbi:MAG TPA: glycosyltransferase family 2 protein [Terriglobia bacterium]|nr:glycosyltransferase family 2 protein [Terriglobia bacterium]